MSYTNKSVALLAADASVGTKIAAANSSAMIRVATDTYTAASNADVDTVGMTNVLPAGAKIVRYAVITSGTAAGAGATLDIGITGSASAIAADLDIAANGTDSADVYVDAGGKEVYMTYDGANPADGNVIRWIIWYIVS